MNPKLYPNSNRELDLSLYPKLPDDAGVRVRTVMALLDCSAATVWRLAKSGQIKSHKVSSRVTVFNVGSVRALLRGG